ncbi:hypothetical protein F931_01567 [Acinetobacter pittii ANC 4050]|uniref:Uncharacterized protein n=1 Tax=Acinetobacter pittii ANC 4050 TaxID=1217691 RepID=R8YHS7_ACIPI|nr:hypothetical protein F931_01567 [Acinetobacter pittii ANC 4050]
MATTTHSTLYISRTSNYEGDGTDDKEEFIETCNIHFKDLFKDQKAISTLSETEKKYFDKCVSASNDKYAAEEVIYDLGVGFAILIVLLGIGWGFYEAKKSLNTPMILNPKENPENDANRDYISDGIIIVFISVIIAAFIYLIFSFVSGIWISIKY